MLQTSLLESKLVKFTPSELETLKFLAVDSEVMVEKGKWWCEDLNVEVLKTQDAVIVVKYLSDSGLSVMYEENSCIYLFTKEAFEKSALPRDSN